MSATEILHTQKTPVILSGFSLLVYLITNIIIKIRINQYLNEKLQYREILYNYFMIGIRHDAITISFPATE